MSDWQPIETAPKDGTEILGWDGIYMTPIQLLPANHFGCGEGRKWHPLGNPTHWMPLPAPPTRPQALGSALLNDIPTLANQAERTRLLDGG